MTDSRYHVLFTDIGGVLGTNGWDTVLRRKVAERFGLDFEEHERRHRLMFDSYERGYMSFGEYLRHVFFDRERSFSVEEVREFAYQGSIPWLDNIAMLRTIRQKNKIRMACISNEGEGLTHHRVKAWKLTELLDFMVFSYAVHMRKPDHAIWKLALELAHCEPSHAIYIDDRPMFVEIAASLGFTAIHHTSLEGTQAALRAEGLDL